MSVPTPVRRRRPGGFTLVEIMIVVTLIGLLASLAIPAMNRIRTRARVTAFVNDLRTGKDAFETYALENGTWPADGTANVPNVMAGYLNLAKYSGTTPLGGAWDWDYGVFGVTAGLSVDSPTAAITDFAQVDVMIDDGNLSTGYFRSRGGGYIMVLEF